MNQDTIIEVERRQTPNGNWYPPLISVDRKILMEMGEEERKALIGVVRNIERILECL